MHGDGNAIWLHEGRGERKKPLKADRSPHDHTRSSGNLCVCHGVFGPRLDDSRAREPSLTDGLAKEARATAARLDEHDLKVRTQAGEDDSRETGAAPDVDHEAGGRQARYGSERVSNVFLEDEREIALAGQTDAAVPEGKQLEEALHPFERPGVEFDVKPSSDLAQERCLRRCHPSASRDGFADEHRAWPGCDPETDATRGRDLLRDEALPQAQGPIDRLLLGRWAGAVAAPGAGKDEHLAVVPLALAPRFNGGVVLEGQMDDPAIARTHGV